MPHQPSLDTTAASPPVDEASIRRQIAAELHDGILQVLTGASLEIQGILRLGARDPEAALALLRGVGEAISNEQRELRLFIEEFREEEEDLAARERRPFPVRLREMLKRIEQVWRVEVELECDPPELGAESARSVLRIAQEAVVNAARHGGANRVRVTVRSGFRRVVIGVTDNGAGFSFRESLDLDQLQARRLGPISLKRRVEAARGTMRIDSSETGSSVRVSIPVARGEA